MDKLFLCNQKQHIYNAYDADFIGDLPVLMYDELRDNPSDARYVFSSWGMPSLSRDEIARLLPNVACVFYAAGSVQGFARPFLESGVRVYSAWGANAVPVAEFAVAQIILANKGYFQLHDRYKVSHADAMQYAATFPGNYGVNVGILGAGQIGRLVMRMLQSYKMSVYVYDPFLSDDGAKALGAIKTTLRDIFANCQTISNHIANNAQTVGMLDYSLFSLMKPNATFINTGRGAQVIVDDFIRALREEPGRTALLDVTDPTEPLSPTHELWTLPNAYITPHRAGSVNDEVRRMGAYMADEYARVMHGEPALYEVNMDMLATMA